MQKPQSRNEAILQSMIDGTEYTDPPQSRIEALLLELKEVIEAGGGEIVVDDEISTTSTHPVQNRVIAANLLPAIAGITPNSSGSMELDREDLNDFTTSGIYNAMNCENAPFNDMALVILGYSMDGYCVQIACDVASGNFKFRNQIDGNWTAWGDNILSTLEAHTAAINELENNTKSIQTATGNPLTIESSESNLVECVAEVEAVQDLHGYDHPWVGGAGKNKLPMTVDGIKAANTSGTWSGNVYTLSGVTFTIQTDSDGNVTGIKANGTANSNVVLYLKSSLEGNKYNNQILSGCDNNGGDSTYYLGFGEANSPYLEFKDTGDGITIQNIEEGRNSFRIYIFIYNNTNMNNKTFHPMIRLSTETDSTFAPYSNISPITGQTEVVIEDVGKNLISNIEQNAYNSNASTYEANYRCRTPIIKINGGESYVFSFATNQSKTVEVLYQIWKSNNYGSNELIKEGQYTSESMSIQKTSDTYVSFIFRYSDNTIITPNQLTAQLEKGSTATTYEPYKGKTYTIQLGDTIYGGELDVVTGELRVNKASYTFNGTESWILQENAKRVYTNVLSSVIAKPLTSAIVANILSNMYYAITSDNSYVGVLGISVNINGAVEISDGTGEMDVNNWKAFLSDNNLQIVYELAEPYTIQLTPEQIRLLKGTNHLSCNTGDLSIKYYPDNVLGQLKGDIESEYDGRIENLEEKAENALKIKSITTNTGTNQQGVSSSSYDNYVQGDKKLIPLSITAKTTGYEVVDVHYVLDEINRLIYFIPKDLTGNAIPSGRTVSMTIYYFEI